MTNLSIFAVGYERSRWLAARAAAAATNVANADTPGYKARDVSPFEAELKTASINLGRTHAGHLSPPEGTEREFELVARPGEATKHSGNSVSLETEMATLGDTRSQQSMVTGVIGAFNRMLLSSCKG